ncbi:hypothetical protein WN944_018787 [Citrus x changshan-huyou]|uniref:Uncharacterized protein n=1 Tax=Citrus x changshan-huyou TaxID=2935761 RepID=A0AAP0LUR5_9ROSI
MSHFVSNHRLSESNKSFVNQLSTVSIPNSVQEALKDPKWKAAMNDEMRSLQKNQSWELVDLPPGKKPVVNLDWLVQQFNVKNVFLHGDLSEEIYMDLPPGCSGPERLNQKEATLSHREVRNNMSLLVRALKQDIEAWPLGQRFDKGKEVALVENGLGFTQAVESYRERGIILKEAKRRRADIGLEDPDKSEEDVNYMVVDPKKRLVVGPVFQAHRDQ